MCILFAFCFIHGESQGNNHITPITHRILVHLSLTNLHTSTPFNNVLEHHHIWILFFRTIFVLKERIQYSCKCEKNFEVHVHTPWKKTLVKLSYGYSVYSRLYYTVRSCLCRKYDFLVYSLHRIYFILRDIFTLKLDSRKDVKFIKYKWTRLNQREYSLLMQTLTDDPSIKRINKTDSNNRLGLFECWKVE